MFNDTQSTTYTSIGSIFTLHPISSLSTIPLTKFDLKTLQMEAKLEARKQKQAAKLGKKQSRYLSRSKKLYKKLNAL